MNITNPYFEENKKREVSQKFPADM